MGTPVTYVDFPVRVTELQVIGTRWVSETMLRLTAGGPAADRFQSGVFDEHVKIIYPDPDTGELRLPVPDPEDPDELIWPRPFPTSREYTVRAYRPERREVDIDLVVHGGGLASDWACGVRPGDPVHLAGPPGGYRIADDYSHYLLAGDETALPAIARWAESAPADTVGWIYVAVPGPGSEQPLPAPPGVTVTWLHTGGRAGDLLAEAVRATPVPEGADLFVWLAGEAGAIKPLRRWVRDERGLDRDASSITGYWKRGSADTHEHLDDEDDEADEADQVGDGAGDAHHGAPAVAAAPA
jgi:NADPH-dependent ferric siderophore reductase